MRRIDNIDLLKVVSPTGNRTPVSRVTGGDTYHYTIEDNCLKAALKLVLFQCKCMGSNPITNMVSGACCEMLNTVISYHKHDTGQSGIIERMIYMCFRQTGKLIYHI